MAEFVLRRTEEMLPEFEQMHRVELFNGDEIKSIIKKTTSYEYKLVRRIKEKRDFLAYIQYKIHLLALIKKRRKKINYYFKKDEIEYAIVMKIHRLFKQCTFRWPEDLKLWLNHVEFCKEWNKKIQLSKIWTAMLQIHGNKQVHLWTMAAKCELEDNHSVENARSIFLRGIRHHPENAKLWQEYFRLELINVMKTRQRLALLKEGEGEEDIADELLHGQAAGIVYKNATQAIPNDCAMKCGFLEIALLFSFFAGELISNIIDDIAENHNDDAKARGALARLHMNSHMVTQIGETSNAVSQKADMWGAEKRCWEDFDSAVDELNTPDMWGEYFKFLFQRVNESRQLSAGDEEYLGFEISGVASKSMAMQKNEVSEMRMNKFLEIAKKGHSCNKLQSELYPKYADVLVDLGRTDDAINILKQCTTQSYEIRIKLLEMAVSGESNVSDEEVMKMFRENSAEARKMDVEQEKRFWNLWFEHSKASNDESRIWEVIEQATRLKSPHLPDIKATYLSWYAEKHSPQLAMELYNGKLTATSAPSLNLIRTMISLLTTPQDSQTVERCYEEGVDHFGNTDTNIWLEYVSYLLKNAPEKVGKVHWRAMKNLKPDLTEKFVTEYSMLLADNK